MKAVFSPKLKKILPLVFCLSLILTVGLYFTFQKQGLFIDEIYSYGLSNSEYAPFLKDLKGGDVVGQIYTRQDLMDYVAVQEGESFGFFQSVYYNQEQDVHPPLYYFFLHLASLLTPNRLSPWSGLALNYVFFLALLLLLDALGRRLFSHPAARWSTLLCYGLSSLALSALNMIRMYMLLSFFLAGGRMLLPFRRMSPSSGAVIPVSSLASVDLPDPDSPTTATDSPFSRLIHTSFKANVLCRPFV